MIQKPYKAMSLKSIYFSTNGLLIKNYCYIYAFKYYNYFIESCLKLYQYQKQHQ